MSSRITTISLDDRTVQIKNKMGGNFSKFVRECCLRWDALHSSPVCEVSEKIEQGLMSAGLCGGFCTPSPSRWCMSCWPHGRPQLQHWKEYREMIKCLDKYPDKLTYYWPMLEKWDAPQDWIQAQAKAANGELFSVENIDLEGNAKPAKKKKVRSSFISRMLNLL